VEDGQVHKHEEYGEAGNHGGLVVLLLLDAGLLETEVVHKELRGGVRASCIDGVVVGEDGGSTEAELVSHLCHIEHCLVETGGQGAIGGNLSVDMAESLLVVGAWDDTNVVDLTNKAEGAFDADGTKGEGH
jgi:hypothetical protein